MPRLNNNIEQKKLSLVEDKSAVYTSEHEKSSLSAVVSEKIENPNRALDQVLVESAQQGDKKAFGLLVEKYHRKLGRILTRMVRDQAEIGILFKKHSLKRIVPSLISEAIALFIPGSIVLASTPQKII